MDEIGEIGSLSPQSPSTCRRIKEQVALLPLTPAPLSKRKTALRLPSPLKILSVSIFQLGKKLKCTKLEDRAEALDLTATKKTKSESVKPAQ